MASEGPNSPNTGTDDGSVGSEVWGTPGSIITSNNSYAQVTLGAARSTHYCRATGFGFAIPSGATIDGVLAEFERRQQSGSGPVVDLSVRLYVNGWTGTDLGTNDPWPGTDTYTSYGGASNLWGATLNPTNVNASTFGVGMAADNPSGQGSIVYIDHIRITVYYTEVTSQVVVVSSVGSVI